MYGVARLSSHADCAQAIRPVQGPAQAYMSMLEHVHLDRSSNTHGETGQSNIKQSVLQSLSHKVVKSTVHACAAL